MVVHNSSLPLRRQFLRSRDGATQLCLVHADLSQGENLEENNSFFLLFHCVGLVKLVCVATRQTGDALDTGRGLR